VIIADAYSNVAAGPGVAADLQKIWGKGFIMLFQRDDRLSNIEDPRSRQNFAIDLRKYEQYVRVIQDDKYGENGVEWLQHHYSYTPEIHNLKAATLLYNVF